MLCRVRLVGQSERAYGLQGGEPTAGHFSRLRVGIHFGNGAAVCFGRGGSPVHLRGKYARTAIVVSCVAMRERLLSVLSLMNEGMGIFLCQRNLCD